MSRKDVEAGLRFTATDVARAEALRTQLYRRWQNFFASHDVVITPTITISPRPWTELYPAEIDGVATKSYFHWLALAYAVTLAGHPAVSLPVGLDRTGMPFGLQIVGPRGGDAYVLGVAASLEALLAGDSRNRAACARHREAEDRAADQRQPEFPRLRLSTPPSEWDGVDAPSEGPMRPHPHIC